MGEVSVVVTSRVLSHTGDNPRERQIAVRGASREILAQLQQVTNSAKRKLVLGGLISLVIGDPGAIWRAHNPDRLEDFDALFGLLAPRPNGEMRLLCELE